MDCLATPPGVRGNSRLRGRVNLLAAGLCRGTTPKTDETRPCLPALALASVAGKPNTFRDPECGLSHPWLSDRLLLAAAKTGKPHRCCNFRINAAQPIPHITCASPDDHSKSPQRDTEHLPTHTPSPSEGVKPRSTAVSTPPNHVQATLPAASFCFSSSFLALILSFRAFLRLSSSS